MIQLLWRIDLHILDPRVSTTLHSAVFLERLEDLPTPLSEDGIARYSVTQE